MYDFVIASSLMTNNSSHKCQEIVGRTVFDNLLSCTKVNGYVIFAADEENENKFHDIISTMQL